MKTRQQRLAEERGPPTVATTATQQQSMGAKTHSGKEAQCYYCNRSRRTYCKVSREGDPQVLLLVWAGAGRPVTPTNLRYLQRLSRSCSLSSKLVTVICNQGIRKPLQETSHSIRAPCIYQSIHTMPQSVAPVQLLQQAVTPSHKDTVDTQTLDQEIPDQEIGEPVLILSPSPTQRFTKRGAISCHPSLPPTTELKS